jgi:hypothetical protein
MDDKGKSPLEDPSSHGNEVGLQSEHSDGMKTGKIPEGVKGYLDSQV